MELLSRPDPNHDSIIFFAFLVNKISVKWKLNYFTVFDIWQISIEMCWSVVCCVVSKQMLIW